MDQNRYCIIMAGGIGSRFWPISRRSQPKQFLDILGTGKSFIRHTYERFAKIIPPENFLVATNSIYKPLVLEHLPERKRTGTLRTGRAQYGPLHRLRRMAAPKRQSRRNDDRHPRRFT